MGTKRDLVQRAPEEGPPRRFVEPHERVTTLPASFIALLRRVFPDWGR